MLPSANIANIPKFIFTIEEYIGIIDHITKESVKANIGEKKYNPKLTWLGIIISFENNLIPSARGCSIP